MTPAGGPEEGSVPATASEPVLVRRLAAVSAVVLVAVLVSSRLRLVAVFGGSWTDEDQALLWFAASEIRSLRFHEPYFYGQPYGSWLEAVVAAPLPMVGVPLRSAVPVGGAVFGLAPWLGFAAVAWWRRRAPVVTLAILAAAVAMSVEGVIVSSMPRGLLPGVVLGCLGACAALAWPRSPVALSACAFLAVVGASMNVGSALVTAPVGAFVGMSALLERDGSRRRRVLALLSGAAAGAIVHLAAQRFYVWNPEAVVHFAPAIGWELGRANENVGRLARYLTAFSPAALESWVVVASAVAGVAAWIALSPRRRGLPSFFAVVVAVGLCWAVLGTAKSNDGAASIFFPFSRLYLGLPWMVCALAVLPASGRARAAAAASAVAARRALPVGAAAVVVVLALALVSAGVREVRLSEDIDRLTAAAIAVPPVAPSETSDVTRRCELRRTAARLHDVRIVLDRYDRTATYACAALLADAGVVTLFPEYDRRSWVQQSADRLVVARVLVSGLDACPPSPLTCVLVDAEDRLYLVSGTRRAATAWASDLGLPVRSLPS